MTAIGLALKGDLQKSMDRTAKRAAVAVTRGMGAGAKGLQSDLRAQTRHARLGRGVEKAWRTAVYPRGGKVSMKAAGIVYSKASRIHAAFTKGANITTRRAKWLVIPLPAAKKMGFDKGMSKSKGSAPRKWSEVEAAIGKYAKLRYIKLGPGRALLVADNLTAGLRRSKTRINKKSGGAFSPVSGRRASAPLFLLVKRVRIKRRIDVKRATKRAASKLPGRIIDAWPDK